MSAPSWEEKEKAEKLKQKMTSAGVGGGSEPISKEPGRPDGEG